MGNLVEKFGAYVGRQLDEHPRRAAALLLTAYRAKRIQLKHFPDKRLSPARDYMAVQSMNAVINCLADPEHAALVSIFMPCELLHAMGIHPMFAEALASYVNGAIAERGFIDYAESRGIGETYCSYHKVLMGGILSDAVPKPRCVVNTSLLCDANNLTFRMAAEHYEIPQQYIDVPYDRTGDSILYVADQLRELSLFLQDLYGQKLEAEKLKEVVATSHRTMEKLAHSQKLKADRFLQNDLTSELYEVFASHVLMGTPQIERYADLLIQDLQKSGPTKGVRLLWMHTIPYYQTALRELLNFNPRCQVIACDMNYNGYMEMDPERPFESMARRLVLDAFNGSAENRIRCTEKLCRELRIDGVVYFCHWGCKQTMGAAQITKQALEATGYPVLVLDGDACDRGNTSNGQMTTRMEAFIEMLEKS